MVIHVDDLNFPFHTHTTHLVPGDPPTNLQVVAANNTELTLSWATPTSCLNYGGPLLGYRIRYRYLLQGNSFVTNDVDVPTTGGTGFRLTNLIPGTLYEVRVAARNAEGVGPAAVAMETTLPSIGMLTGKHRILAPEAQMY